VASRLRGAEYTGIPAGPPDRYFVHLRYILNFRNYLLHNIYVLLRAYCPAAGPPGDRGDLPADASAVCYQGVTVRFPSRVTWAGSSG